MYFIGNPHTVFDLRNSESNINDADDCLTSAVDPTAHVVGAQGSNLASARLTASALVTGNPVSSCEYPLSLLRTRLLDQLQMFSLHSI